MVTQADVEEVECCGKSRRSARARTHQERTRVIREVLKRMQRTSEYIRLYICTLQQFYGIRQHACLYAEFSHFRALKMALCKLAESLKHKLSTATGRACIHCMFRYFITKRWIDALRMFVYIRSAAEYATMWALRRSTPLQCVERL